MIEEVLKNVYKMEIPLPGNPLKVLNSYLFKGDERSLIIDTGLNHEACLETMTLCLKKLNVDLSKTDFYLSHLHADHIGLIERLMSDCSIIYFNEIESLLLNSGWSESEDNKSAFSRFYRSHGFPEDELKQVKKGHQRYRYNPNHCLAHHRLKEGDTLHAGDYLFSCVETPGHSPGHMCLYDKEKKLLISGDHILSDITPIVAYWPNFPNPLKAYLASLDKVYTLEVDLVLPGHRTVIVDHRRRIRELGEHHRIRADEILSALKQANLSTWELASHLTWDTDFSSWDVFPAEQKWFAFGETAAHLTYLEGEDKIRPIKEGNIIRYSLR